MKLKFFIKSIDSTAEDIYVKSYGQNVFEFHREDFDNDWNNIVNQKYELDPCLAADLDKLKMFGNEDHDTHFSHKDKVNWFEFARNKLRDDLFGVSERIADIDLDKMVEIYNKNKINNLQDFVTTVNKIPSSIKYADLSTMNIADTFEESSDNSDGLLTYNNYSIKEGWLGEKVRGQIIKMPQLPKNLTLADKIFYNFTGLEDISNLDFSNILEAKNVFYLNKIKDFSFINFDNLLLLKGGHFINCVNTIEQVKLDFKKLTSLSVNLIRSCWPEKPFTVNSITTPTDTKITSSLLYCSNVSHIGNISIGCVEANSYGGVYKIITDNINTQVNNIEEVGNIDISSVKGTNSGSRIQLFGDYGFVKKIGNINIGSLIGQLYINGGIASSGSTFGDITITCTTSENYSRIYLGQTYDSDNETTSHRFGNVLVKNENTLNVGLYLRGDVGVVGISGNVSVHLNTLNNIKAMPRKYGNCVGYASSTGQLWWCDSIDKPDTDYSKNITKYYMDVSMQIDTPDKHCVKEIDITDCLLKLNPDYPYDFKLKSFKVETEFSDYSLSSTTSNLTLTDIQSADIKVLTISGKDNSVKLSFDIETVKDTSVIKLNNINTYKCLIYEAEIDGAPFTGKVPIILFGEISFEVIEDISSDFQVEYEEGETPIEPEEEETLETGVTE